MFYFNFFRFLILYMFQHRALSDTKLKRQLLSGELDPKSTKLPPIVKFVIGSKVMLTMNLDSSVGLFNGAMGNIVAFYYLDTSEATELNKLPFYFRGSIQPHISDVQQAAQTNAQLPIVLVAFDKSSINIPGLDTNRFESTDQIIIPIPPETISFQYGKSTNIYRSQLPLQICNCVTVHKCQSLSKKELGKTSLLNIYLFNNIFYQYVYIIS